MKVFADGVLGLFPSFSGIGGVERSGRAAWKAITGASAGENHLICYGAPISDDVAEIGGKLHQVRGQIKPVLLAASRRWPARLVVVWHVGMLKLLPFIRTNGSRTILFLHGIEAWRPVSPAVARLLRRVDLFLTNSDYTWKRFCEHHPDLRLAAHRTVALGLGDPLSAGPPEPADPPSALMIGRIARSEAYKGHDAVIAAWRQVLESIPGARLRMIGPCDMREELLRLAARHGVGHAVEIAGPVSETAKERYLAECRCMALPSRGEGFGLAYIESMRMGRPCVVSTLDAGREVVCPENGNSGDDAAGLAADPADAGALSSGLIRLMTPGPEWCRWSEAGRRRYAAHYTEVHFRKRLIAALTGFA